MRIALRNYLLELISGFLNISFFLLDILGIILLFWSNFPWAQVIGLIIFGFSFGAVNFRIYWRQHQLLKSKENQTAKRLHILRALLSEVRRNDKGHITELTDETWQYYRDQIFWLPNQLQEYLNTYYRALHLLLSAVRDGFDKGYFIPSGHLVPTSMPTEIDVWSGRIHRHSNSVDAVFEQLTKALQEQIDLLEGEAD